MNTIRVSNNLDPDQAPRFVGPALGPNCFQRLSADDTSRQSNAPMFSNAKNYVKLVCV